MHTGGNDSFAYYLCHRASQPVGADAPGVTGQCSSTGNGDSGAIVGVARLREYWTCSPAACRELPGEAVAQPPRAIASPPGPIPPYRLTGPSLAIQWNRGEFDYRDQRFRPGDDRAVRVHGGPATGEAA